METKDFEKYLRSINGLENGYTVIPFKKTHPFKYRMFQLAKKFGYTDEQNPFRVKIINRDFFAVKDGWLALTKQCIEACITLGKWDKKILQCKQHYGAFRFRIANPDPKLIAIIKQYEDLSKTVCEHCSSRVDVTQTKGWVMSLCPRCIVKEKEFWKTAKNVPSAKKHKKKSKYKHYNRKEV